LTAVLAVSPHLDDALLSCGVALLRHARAGDRVVIATAFAGGAAQAVRREEDAAACRHIGAEFRHLSFPDAPIRSARYEEIAEIVFGVPDSADLDAAERLRRALRASIHELAPGVVYGPLAVGTHIDHRLTFEAMLGLRAPTMLLYEDRPYCLWRGLTGARLRAVGADSPVDMVPPQALAAGLDRVAFTRAFVPVGPLRDALLPRYLAALEARPRAQPCLLEPEATVRATSEERDTLWGALREYGSQIDALFPTRADFDRDNEAHARYLDASARYVERSWRFAGC
jgi:LmbE family N-acetylglucosaminyl deacetylase